MGCRYLTISAIALLLGVICSTDPLAAEDYKPAEATSGEPDCSRDNLQSKFFTVEENAKGITPDGRSRMMIIRENPDLGSDPAAVAAEEARLEREIQKLEKCLLRVEKR